MLMDDLKKDGGQHKASQVLDGTTYRPGGGLEVLGGNRRLSMSTWYDTVRDTALDIVTLGKSRRDRDHRAARQWNNYINTIFDDGVGGAGETAGAADGV